MSTCHISKVCAVCSAACISVRTVVNCFHMFQMHRQCRIDIPSPEQAHIFTNHANTAQMMKAVVKDRCQTLHCWPVAWILALTLSAQSNGIFGHNVLHHQTLWQFSAHLLYPLARFQWQKLTKKIKLLERRYYFIWIKINSVRSSIFSGSRNCKI